MRLTVWLALLLAAALVWLSIGVFPMASIEGDGTGIAQGAHHLAEHGLSALGQTYRYEIQAGTYVPLVLLRRFFGADTFYSFSLLSAFAALAFILLSARWTSRRTGLSFPACGLLVLLLQESWTSAFYPNSSIVAAAVMMLALNVFTDARDSRSLALGGCLFGLACWIRFDVILLAPAVPLLLPWTTAKQAARRTLLVASVACLSALIAFFLTGGTLAAIGGYYRHHEHQVGSWGLALKSCLAFFSLVVAFLALLGVVRTARHDRRELVLMLVAAVPLVLLLRSSLTTPKYLLYLVPLVAMLMAQGIALVRQSGGWKKTVLVAAAVAMFLVQYPLGLQVQYAQGYHPEAYPTVLPLLRIPLQRGSVKQLAIVVGAGATLSTHDSIRLSSGIAFANVAWRHYKQQTARVIDTVARYVETSSSQAIGVYVEEAWEARQLAEQAMLRHGYSLVATPDDTLVAVWKKGDRQVQVLCGAQGLKRAKSLAAVSPVLAVVMWDDHLPKPVEMAFPNAQPLTPAACGHASYLLSAPNAAVLGPR